MYDVDMKTMISYMISQSSLFLHDFDIIKIHDIIYSHIILHDIILTIIKHTFLRLSCPINQ
jgi:hypothetical protein